MLVIRPNHKSQKLNLADALSHWAQLNIENASEEDLQELEKYRDVFVVIKQVTREVFVESMARARSAAEDVAGEKELFNAMADLVRFGLEEVIGLVDENGPVEIKSEAGSMPDDCMELLGMNNLTIDLWRVVKCYNELGANEKKHFGEQAQLTSAA